MRRFELEHGHLALTSMTVWRKLYLLGFLVLAGCTSSGTDVDKAAEEMREEEELDRRYMQHNEEGRKQGQYYETIARRYVDSFGGNVQPEVGCDACPRLCEHIDLRPIAPDAFKRRFLEMVHVVETGKKPDTSFANWELRRLKCMALAGGESLQQVYLSLMDSDFPRYQRFLIAMLSDGSELFSPRAIQVLSELREPMTASQYEQETIKMFTNLEVGLDEPLWDSEKFRASSKDPDRSPR